MWKGDAAGRNTKRYRAVRRYELGRCEYEGCKADAVDRHHIDGDTGNNAPENIARYCRRHHMLVDGRLARFGRTVGNRGKGRPGPPLDVLAEIRRRYEAGESLSELAVAFGCSRRAIDYRIRKAGGRPRPLSEAQRVRRAREASGLSKRRAAQAVRNGS